MDKKKKLELFKRNMLLDKREVLESLTDYIHYFSKPDLELCSDEKRQIILKLANKFRGLIEDTHFPEIREDWWYYEYSITNDGMKLELGYCEEVLFDEEGMINEMTTSQVFELLTMKCNYLTVEEYATQYNVTTTTVRQWIRRGKLRTARKLGGNWMIPEIADKPRRGYEGATYSWEYPIEKLEEKYSFLKGYRNIYLFQDEKNKSKYYGILSGENYDNRNKIELSKSELESLELALIAQVDVNVEETLAGIMYVPDKRGLS